MEREISLRTVASCQESIEKITESVFSGSFLLGLNMGVSSNCPNKTDIITCINEKFPRQFLRLLY